MADVEAPLERMLARYARTHGPFTTADARGRYGVDPSSALAEAGADVVWTSFAGHDPAELLALVDR